jgi:mannan endo-1,4-beta-mannosidase
MRKIICTLLTVAAVSGCTESEPAVGFRPVNPDATKEARQLLEFLYSIQGKYTLTGQHNFISGPARYDSVVLAMTGKRPVVWGSDFSFNATGDNQREFHHCGPMNLNTPWGELRENGLTTAQHRQNLVDEIKVRHAEGRIITLMWHCCWPTFGDDCNGDTIWTWADGLPSDETWAELTTEGTALNDAWKRQVDAIVPYLKQLQEAKIPVLWRPYHEMNGVWFWWCNKPGDEGFRKLWIMMYERFTYEHGLDNLLWVWNTNAPRDIPGDEAFPYADFYPGSEYVDVLAADVYRGDYRQSHHDQLLELGGGKLITLGEVGQLPTVEQYDTQPSWSWFMVWGYFVSNRGNAELAKQIYDHPRSLTLDEIDFSRGRYELKNSFEE